MIRFLHSADLHIGKPFGAMPEDLRARLREARHGVLGRLAAAAREGGAAVILLAGDSFDTETPSPAILRQALAAMAHSAPLRWILLPGNHDSLLAEALWAAARAHLPPNVTLAHEASPLALASGAVVLPAPCTARRPGRDLTAWMDAAATPEGALRIGLAHGPVHDFSEDGSGMKVIAPDRAARAGLDYLALGDWHGQMAVAADTWYAGTPEPDRFKHEQGGRALLVSIAGAGAVPQVVPVETGRFLWRSLPLTLISGEDAVASLAPCLPQGAMRRQMLMRITATGRLRPQARAALAAAVEAVAPEFALLELDTQGLMSDCESADLDLIDRSGALRQAADHLFAQGSGEQLDAASRAVARAALVRLFSYCAAMAGESAG